MVNKLNIFKKLKSGNRYKKTISKKAYLFLFQKK